ncbi:Os12g0204000 [Oryza sativa Japonica Group]|uniref:Os12g0204000 protein n=1 Tax=Oryza sativa subsp. japonica TaxID=39947 RepID=A0A0P0Y813_ORYSJ|nr:hypothetical protein EE612_058359 [Oryza sativa]BAT16279.1 Os12g0204000 [Oryza sativa Japonica Group]
MAEASSSTHRRRSQAQISKIAPRSDVWKHFTCFIDGDGQAKARCKHQESRHEHPGAHWKRHEQRKETPGAAESAQHPAPPPPPSSGPEAAASGDLARMIALHGYDPSLVEDDYFRSFLRRLNPNFEVPSRLAIEEMCDAIFDETRKDIFSRLYDFPSKVSIAVGTVRTIQGNVLYMACHFIDDEWNLHKVIMDAYVIVPFLDYHGPLLGVDEVCLDPDIREFAIKKVMVRFSNDEVLNNLFMMVWETKDNDINLEHELRNEIEKNQNYTNPNRRELICTTYMDSVIHSIARLLIVHQGFKDDIISNLLHLDLTRQERHQLLSQLELFKLREVFKDQKARASGENAISYNESNGFPGAKDGNYVADVLGEAMVAIEKAIQDSYPVWSIPLVLDPRYKLARTKFIFQTAFGTEAAADYISKVTQNITKLYSDYVEDHGSAMNVVAVSSTDPLQQAWDEHCRGEAQTDLDRYLKDELVHDPTSGFDILNWWKVHGSVLYPTVALMAGDALAMPTCSKPSAEQIAHITSIVRGYSKKRFAYCHSVLLSD